MIVKSIIATHAHFDHVFGAGYYRNLYDGAKIYVHKKDDNTWVSNKMFAVMFGVAVPSDFPDKPDVYFGNDFTFKVGEYTFVTVPTPGHTPGGCCFYQAENRILLTGDTLFDGSIGRTDFPGSDSAKMRESIYSLDKLPGDCLIYPGHESYGKQLAPALNKAKRMV